MAQSKSSGTGLERAVYVSPSGSDGGAGTAEAPLRTLGAAREAVRRMRAGGGGGAGGAGGAVSVILRGGTYELAEPLVLTAEDSGTAEGPVVWRAAPGEQVTVSGGRTLALRWEAYRDGIFRAELPAGVMRGEGVPDQLFVDGERQQMARYPNADPAVAIFNGYAADAISPERVARWADPTTAYFHAMHPGQWGGFSYRVTGKNGDGTLKLEGGWQGNRADRPHETYRFVENVFEELDAPGEWFADGRTGTLYFYPPAGVELGSAVVQVAGIRHLVELRGSVGRPVRWVEFRGMRFTQTARTFMETREPLLRSDWTIYRGGAFVFDGTEDCTVAECHFDQVGGNAVFVNNYNRRAAVRACRIERSGAGGVTFVGDPGAVRSPLFEYGERQEVEGMDLTPGPKGGSGGENYPADCVVEDCLITQVGRYEKQSTGVGIDMAARVTVRHCSIYDMPRAGINIGDGCWGGHVVEFCDVFDTVKETGDHGSFNSWGRDRYWVASIEEVDARVAAHPELPLLDAVEPIELRNNRWRCDHGWDIDLDDGSSNYRIYNNLCLNGGIKNREGYRRTVENNVLVGNGFHPHVWYANSGDVFSCNIVFEDHRPVKMPAVWGRSVDHNLMHDAGVASAVPAERLRETSGQDAASLRGDARFVDPGRGDYRVGEGSPALGLGFANFPMDGFGVRPGWLRRLARTPSFAVGTEERSGRDPTVRVWRGMTVRNVVGLGERSAYGLPREAGVVVLEVAADAAWGRAGVRAGDVIVRVGEVETDEFGVLAGVGRPGRVTVWRGQRGVVIELAE